MHTFLKVSAYLILTAAGFALIEQPLARAIRRVVERPRVAVRPQPLLAPPQPVRLPPPAAMTPAPRPPSPPENFVPPPEMRDGFPLTVTGETFVVGPVEHFDSSTGRQVERSHALFPYKPPHRWMVGKYDLKYGPQEPVIGDSTMLIIYLNDSTPRNPRWVLRYPRPDSDVIRPADRNPYDPSDRYYVNGAAVHHVMSYDGKEHIILVSWQLKPRTLWTFAG